MSLPQPDPSHSDLSAVNDMAPDDAAATYAAAGYRVVIVHGVTFPPDLDGAPACTCPDPHRDGSPGGAHCPSAGKHPRFNAWATDPSTRDPGPAYQRYPVSNVGLAMGYQPAAQPDAQSDAQPAAQPDAQPAPDGPAYLVAVDLDGSDGAASLEVLTAELGALPPTLTASTPGGGLHLVLRLPPGADPSAVRNRAGKLRSPSGAPLPGLDVRAEGGQIVVAPSMHACGTTYQWTDGREPATAPAAWAAWLCPVEASEPQPRRAPSPIRDSAPLRPRRYARAILDAACEALRVAPRGTRNSEATAQSFGVGGLLHVGAYSEDEALAALTAATQAGGWDASAAAKTLDTLRRGLTDGAAVPRDVPPPPESDSGHQQAPSPARDHAPATDSTPPVIRIREPELQRMVEEGIAALAERDRNLYQRGGEFVTIVREPDRVEPNCAERSSGAVECPTCRSPVAVPCARDTRSGSDVSMRPGTPRLRAISSPVLLERLSVAARWMRFDGRSKEWNHAAPCGRVASIIHAADREKSAIRPVRGILEAPAPRPDGTIIDAPGYDDATGFVFIPSCAFPRIADHPTQADSAAALRRLWIELCADFPYRGLGEADPADVTRERQYERALLCPDAFVGLSAYLTIIARPAILGAIPGTIFEAATQGSGKTLQIHAISVAATGRPAGVMTFPASRGEPNEEELEKVLSAYALASARIVAFDNVKASLGGPGLEKVLTAVDKTDFRILGSTDVRTLPWSAAVMFTGNNLTMSDDVAQRVLVSRLESPREDPRSRPARTFFRENLLASVAERRPQLVADALTVLRAYYCARAAMTPDQLGALPTLGSFEAWSRIIPPAIAYAGGPSVLAARPKLGGDTNDAEAEAHATLLRQWPYTEPVRASDVLHLLFDTEYAQHHGKAQPDGRDELRAAVRTLTRTSDGKEPNSTAFGKALGKLRGKIRNGMRIDAETDRKDTKQWRVVDLERRETAPAVDQAPLVETGADPYADEP